MSLDYVLLILNCYKYRDKALLQKEQWLHKLPADIRYFHVIGDVDKCGSDNFLFDEVEKILYVSTPDDYNSLPKKVISAFEAVNKTYDYKYILKTDDDQRLINDNFFVSLKATLSNSKCHYGGSPVAVNNHISNYYTVHDCLPRNLLLKKTVYCNGRFYLLSKQAINNLLTKSTEIKEHYIEDHAVGYYLDDEFKINMMLFDSKHIFTVTT